MGRPQKELDEEALLDLLSRGATPPEIGQVLGATPPTIRSRIALLQKEQGVLLQYRTLQNLRLTELQHLVLEAITPDKIAEAPLGDLVKAFKILKDKELVMTGQPTDIKGLVGYLVELEKQDLAGSLPVQGTEVLKPLDFTRDPDSEDYIPQLN